MKYFLLISLILMISWPTLANDLKLKTRLFIDADSIGPYYQKDSNIDTKNKNNIELSSLKSTLKYRFNSQITSKFQVELTKEAKNDYENEIEIKDALINWDLQNNVKASIGRFKEPMGHESLMGSNTLATIERSMATSAFSPGRNLGVQVSLNKDLFILTTGLFKIEDDDIQNGMASTSRASIASNRNLITNIDRLHFAASYSYRDLNNSLFQIKERAEVNSADNVIRSPRAYTKDQHIMQFELGASMKNYWFMSEVYQTQLNQTAGEAWIYQGFYAQLSGTHNLFSNTSEARYSYKNGEFKTPKHQTHDLEWVIRYSGISLRDHSLGSKASSFALGLNYYFKKSTSIMANYLIPDISGNVVNTNQSGQALSFRFRHIF